MSFNTPVNIQNDETIKICPFVPESKLKLSKHFLFTKWASQFSVCS